MDETHLSTRLAIIEERHSVMQAGIGTMSADMREMKEALLEVLAGIKSRGDRHIEYEARFEKIEAATAKLNQALYKALGIVSVFSLVASPVATIFFSHFRP